MLLDVVLAAPPAGPSMLAAFARWLALEGRAEPPPERPALETTMADAGFELHVTEDAGPRQSDAIKAGLARLMGGLRREDTGPNGGGRDSAGRNGAVALMAEAEVWLLRQRLLAAGVIQLARWHATLRR